MEHPKVSVVMSVYNGEKHLREAIDSILNQTFTDFEFIIINDGSTDKTQEILESYSDPRIRLFHQENIGLTKSLNRGIELARGEYIARMDDDDISLPQRLEKQVIFLNKRKEITCVGCYCFIIDSYGNRTGKIDWGEGQSYMLYNILTCNNPVGHPMVMYRKEIVKFVGLYSENYKTCQDMELWVRLYFNKFECDNIPEYLFKYRTHKDQISTNNDEKNIFIQIYKYYIDQISPNKYSEIQIEQYQNCYVWQILPVSLKNTKLYFNLFADILIYFKSTKINIGEVKRIFIKVSNHKVRKWNLKLYLYFYFQVIQLYFKL